MTVHFMIIGAQKAATSSLQAALQAVPGVYMPHGESPFFEDPDYAERPWERFADPSQRAAIAGIKRPDILCRPDLIQRIARHSPESKFIIVLREPISRAVSAYYHLARHAHIPAEGLNAGLRRGPPRLPRWDREPIRLAHRVRAVRPVSPSLVSVLPEGSLPHLRATRRNEQRERCDIGELQTHWG